MSKIRPLHNRLIVKRLDEDDKTAGGIIIPDSAKEKPSQGRVVHAGAGRRDDAGNLIAMEVQKGDRVLREQHAVALLDLHGNQVAMEVQKGDRVLFSKYAGSDVSLDGEDHLIITEDDVLAILE